MELTLKEHKQKFPQVSEQKKLEKELSILTKMYGKLSGEDQKFILMLIADNLAFRITNTVEDHLAQSLDKIFKE